MSYPIPFYVEFRKKKTTLNISFVIMFAFFLKLYYIGTEQDQSYINIRILEKKTDFSFFFYLDKYKSIKHNIIFDSNSKLNSIDSKYSTHEYTV